MAHGHRRISWSHAARASVDEAVEFIAADAPGAALKLLDRILAAAASLETFAERGRIVPELTDPTVRELFVSPFRLIYEVRAGEVSILALLHQARDFERWRREDSRPF